MFHFIRNYQNTFQSGCTAFHSHNKYMNLPATWPSAQNLLSGFYFILISLTLTLNRYVMLPNCGFNLHFLMTNDIKHLFMFLFANHISLVTCLFNLLPIFYFIYVCVCVCVCVYIYIFFFRYKSIMRYLTYKYILLVCSFFFHFISVLQIINLQRKSSLILISPISQYFLFESCF